MKRLALLLAIPLIAIQFGANDTFVTKGAGGLVPVKTSQIVMESEDLEIGQQQSRGSAHLPPSCRRLSHLLERRWLVQHSAILR